MASRRRIPVRGRAGPPLWAAALSLLASHACACADPQQTLVQAERLTERELKAEYLACARESGARPLTLCQAARCSIAADVLKERSFGGDFDALIAWWHLHRDSAAAKVE